MGPCECSRCGKFPYLTEVEYNDIIWYWIDCGSCKEESENFGFGATEQRAIDMWNKANGSFNAKIYKFPVSKHG